ncbi:unnamed protein product [Porites lobata]|uniref:Vps16 C-terminal domain-containing protein n=1 Tax=Porites lobata TaxID=104759 RepID=A0ABN8P573_9CNID|nr:unnamed protein product [Porites lobata]
MRMSEDDLALEKAIMSGDTDLVYMVVMHLKDNLTLGEFLMAIRYHPVALSLYIKVRIVQRTKRARLKIAALQERPSREGLIISCVTPGGATIESKMNTLSKAQMSYQQGGFQFYSKETEEQMKLMEYQVKLEEKYRKTFMDLSLSDTIYQHRLLYTFHCILQGDLKVAEQLKKEFRVPDKRFTLLMLYTLVFYSHFLKLAWNPTIDQNRGGEICLQSSSRVRNFEKLANHVPPIYKRHFNFCPRKYEDAAETAFSQKSEEDLDLVLGKCATSNRPLVNRIQEMKAQLRQRR